MREMKIIVIFPKKLKKNSLHMKFSLDSFFVSYNLIPKDFELYQFFCSM